MEEGGTASCLHSVTLCFLRPDLHGARDSRRFGSVAT